MSTALREYKPRSCSTPRWPNRVRPCCCPTHRAAVEATMSFILDALKKSEIERQRQTVPGLMDARSRARRHRLPVWALALGILLAINLLVLTFLLSRKTAPGPHA